MKLTSSELDMVLLGTVHSSINCSDISVSGRIETAGKRTSYCRISFFYHGRRICGQTFLFLHRIHQRRFYSLLKQYKKNGLSVRTHWHKKGYRVLHHQVVNTNVAVVSFATTRAEVTQCSPFPMRDSGPSSCEGDSCSRRSGTSSSRSCSRF